MKLLFTLLLLPVLSIAQNHNSPCTPQAYTQFGGITSPKGFETIVGFQLAYFQPVSRFNTQLGAGVEAVRIRQQWKVPLQLHVLQYLTTTTVSPVLQLSGGYILNGSEAVQGATFYAAAGIAISSAVLVGGYQVYGD